MVKFKIFKFDMFYDDEYCTSNMSIFSNVEWEECTEEEYRELVKGVQLINSRRSYNDVGKLAIITMIVDQDTQINLCREAVLKETKRLEREEAKRKKAQEEKKAQAEARKLERKRKQLQKLKQELGESDE